MSKFSSRSEVLALFDVDGTLTPHRNAIQKVCGTHNTIPLFMLNS